MSLEVKNNPFGITVLLDGQEVPELVDFELRCAVDDIARARLVVNATDPLNLRLDRVHTTIVLANRESDDVAYTALLNRLRVVAGAIANDSALVLRNKETLFEIFRQNVERYRAGDTSDS